MPRPILESRRRRRRIRAFVLTFLTLMFCVICAGTSYSQPSTKTASTASAPSGCLPATNTQGESSRMIYQQFPAQGPPETAWGIIWSENGRKGLWIEGAWFWRKPPFNASNAIQVLGRAGLSQIFVPYHEGSSRLYDLVWGELNGAIPQDTGVCGVITDPPIVPPSGNAAAARRVLIKEIRDRGIAWTSDRQTRRGQEMLLWATYDAGNYEYIIQYGFRDDGTVTFRLGSTGYNNPPLASEPHMHNALWYIDIDLAGSANDSVMLMKHSESATSPTASDSMTSFNNGVEGFADWKAEEFTGLNIMDLGHNISYDLMPLRTGTARHSEAFSQHDFWVTRKKSNELDYNYGLPTPYVNGESIASADVAIWYMSSSHHHPRDEDFEGLQPIQLPGVALVMWSGFDLHPHNLLNDTPLHKPACAAVPSGLVAWWSFDEGSGATKVFGSDASGKPGLNNGTPQPSALGAGGPIPVPGAIRGALAFDGIDDYVQIPDAPSLDFGKGDFTIDAWLRTTQKNTTAVILDKRQSSPLRGYYLYTKAGKLAIQLVAGGKPVDYISQSYVADGNWHHIGITVDRSSQVPKISWFLDGILSTITHPNPLAGSLDNSSPLRLGVRSVSLDGYWNGVLDELELFNRAMSPGEVYSIYAAGREGKCRDTQTFTTSSDVLGTEIMRMGSLRTDVNVTSGLQRTIFTTPLGNNIYVNLPQDLTPGETHAGTVFGDATGQTDAETAARKAELRNYFIEIGGQRIPATGKPFELRIPASPPQRAIAAVLMDEEGKEVARADFPIATQAFSPATGLKLPSYSSGTGGGFIEIECLCDGIIADSDYVRVAGKDILVLAESPRKIVALNTSAVQGWAEIEVSERRQVTKGRVSLLAIKLSAPKIALRRGELTTLTVEVTGLKDLQQDVSLRLENRTPSILTMEPANVQELTIKPSEVQPGGRYIVKRTLRGIQGGTFHIEGTVIKK
jgi:hypothetical protein